LWLEVVEVDEPLILPKGVLAVAVLAAYLLVLQALHLEVLTR
jgi:hypothetical protein